MAAEYVLAIDQGTSGTTALILALGPGKAQVLAKSTEEFPQYYPQPAWVEHELEEIWQSVSKATVVCLEKALQVDRKFKPKSLSAIGITNQRETLCFFDRKTLQPLCRAIVWQCRRSVDICNELKEKVDAKWLREKTGLVFDPYFSGSKIKWVLDTQASIRDAVQNKTAFISTVDAYLLARLTHGSAFCTEASNASRTLLYDIKKGQWDAELYELFGLTDADNLPEVKDSVGIFGKTSGLSFLPDGIPIAAMLGDQQAALAGQACFSIGEAKCTYGTGAFLLTQLGDKLKFSEHGLLSTVAWSLGGKLSYALEGSAFIAGAAMMFLRDQLLMIQRASDSEGYARGVAAAPEIYFVPALSGLSAPWWNPNARGAIFGLSRGSSKAQFIRAGLEGVAFSVYDLITAMANDMGQSLSRLRVDGGAAANDLLLEIQADLAQIPVERSLQLENTGIGVALFAALGVGYFNSLDELKILSTAQRVFQPNLSPEAQTLRQKQLDGWKKAVDAVQVFHS